MKALPNFASTRNSFEPISECHFPDIIYSHLSSGFQENFITPDKVQAVMRKMKMKLSMVPGDIPIRLLNLFSEEMSKPLTNLINTMFEQGNYPIIWKTEFITPINKVKLPEDRSQLRPLSGVFNFAKITDCIISSMIIDDMSPNRDMSQYGNEKGISLNPLMVNMIHRILSGVDKNSEKEKMAVFLTMIDHKRAFENQSHILGVRSFLTNGVRKSLIPVLINFFSGRKRAKISMLYTNLIITL